MKFAPLLFPIFARLYVFVHWHFVPYRIVASWFPDFITGGRLGEQVTAPAVPSRFEFDDVGARAKSLMAKSTISQYLGIPPMSDATINALGARTFDVLPFACFYKVWYDWYRDRNYTADNTILPLAAGTISATATIDALMETKWRHWEADYFTTAQTNTQRGAEVLMPLQGTGSVTYSPTSTLRRTDGTLAAISLLAGTTAGSAGQLAVEKTASGASGVSGRLENIATVSLTSSDVSINDFRRAYALQVWLERNQLAGSRMDESIMAHFGRRTSDSRLQMAEYLGGSKTAVQISELLSQSEVGADPLGSYGGNAMSYGNDNKFTYNCEEWGMIFATMSVMPKTSYKQGLPRMFQQRNSFLDYPWPTFAHLGEQEVYNNELWIDSTSLPVDRTAQPIFGYTSRYSDWKQMSSFDSGDFFDTMEAWTITRKFSSLPVLGNTFVQFDSALQDQIFAVAAADTLWCYVYNNVKVKRSLPYYGTPKLNA